MLTLDAIPVLYTLKDIVPITTSVQLQLHTAGIDTHTHTQKPLFFTQNYSETSINNYQMKIFTA